MDKKTSIKVLITVGLAFTAINLIFCIVRYINAIIFVQEKISSNNPLYIITAMVIPFLWWAISTYEDRWNFHDRKEMTLKIVMINFILVFLMPLWTLIFDIAVIRICKIPAGRNMDTQMILNLCRLVLVGVCGGVGAGLYGAFNKIISKQQIKQSIDGFRIQHILDFRDNKGNLYDLVFMKDLKTGKDRIIEEDQRFVQMLVIGSSGTGKTSSTATPAIVCDLNQKMKNALKRHAALQQMVEKGHAEVRLPVAGIEDTLIEEAKNGGFKYDMSAERLVQPKEGYEDEFKAIRKKYPDCGLTVMAPNNSLNDDVIKLAKARSIKVNVIDPDCDYSQLFENVHQIRINPFFVELGLEPTERLIQISGKAQAFSEVIQSVNELKKASDPYFADINTAVTTNIAIVCMLYANLQNQQTNIEEIQRCIDEFLDLQPKVDFIEKELGMKVRVSQVQNQRGRQSGAPEMGHDLNSNGEEGDKPEVQVASITYIKATDESEIPEKYREMGMGLEEFNDMRKNEAEAYGQTIHFIKQELLGNGYEKMYDQARGLRNMIDKMLLNPHVKSVLSATDQDVVDWDRILANSEVTVINTAISNTKESSTMLGLFNMLNMQLSIYRRPKGNRPDHFLLIDEASQYMHAMYDDMMAYYRQFRVGVTLMFQSLSQMDKNETTKYLKGVVLGAGNHIVFGRVSAEDMKLYEALAGIKIEDVVQESRNYDSEFDENHKISHSERVTPTEKAATSGTDIRFRDFQEVSVFTQRQGQVLPAFTAKMSFAKDSDYDDCRTEYVDWSQYFPEGWEEYYVKKEANENVYNRGSELAEKYSTKNGISLQVNEKERGLEHIPPVSPEEEAKRNANRQRKMREQNEPDPRKEQIPPESRQRGPETVTEDEGHINNLSKRKRAIPPRKRPSEASPLKIPKRENTEQPTESQNQNKLNSEESEIEQQQYSDEDTDLEIGTFKEESYDSTEDYGGTEDYDAGEDEPEDGENDSYEEELEEALAELDKNKGQAY